VKMIEGEERSAGSGAQDDAPAPGVAAEGEDLQPMEQEEVRDEDGGQVD